MIPLWNQLAHGTLTDAQLGQLDRYLDLLIEKNQVLNLTRITGRAEAEVKHVADALTLLPYLPAASPEKPRTLADVGTGGGIPGVILAIARPDLQVTLIDSTRKKLDAVQEMAEQAGVANVRMLHSRIESADERFDVVTARAVAETETLLTWCGGIVKRNGVLLALKGPRLDEELSRLTPGTRKRWSIQTHDVATPELTGHRILVAKPQ